MQPSNLNCRSLAVKLTFTTTRGIASCKAFYRRGLAAAAGLGGGQVATPARELRRRGERLRETATQATVAAYLLPPFHKVPTCLNNWPPSRKLAYSPRCFWQTTLCQLREDVGGACKQSRRRPIATYV